MVAAIDNACGFCGAPIPAEHSAGYPRTYCSNPCAQKALGEKGGCGGRRRKRAPWTADEDAELRRVYDSRPETITKLARRLGRERWDIRRRAHLLGLSRPRGETRAWTPEEEERLANLVSRSSWKAIAKALGRPETACRVRAKRLRLYRRGTYYTAWAAAQVMGCDPKKVVRWVEAGKLQAKRVSDCGSRSPYRITHRALRTFLLTYPGEVDLRRVETNGFKETLFDLLANSGHGAGAFGEDGLSRGDGDDEGDA